MVSHPGKFSHPSAKTSSIIASCKRQSDGLLRTGNVDAELDVFGNAAALDVFKFLMLPLQNGKSVLQNLEDNTLEIQQQLSLKEFSFEELREDLLAIKQNSESGEKTAERIKQVYFPVNGDYHLLSILTPSGLMFKLKERINDIRFSDQAKQARERKRKNELDKQGYSEIYDLTVIGFGGTKPQNISVLNNQNYGQAYLLQSLPPRLQSRTIHPPKRSFFTNTLNPWHYQESFQSFHKLIAVDYNNINIREGRDKLIQFIILQVIERMWMIRQLQAGWSEGDTYKKLPVWQKHWLDEIYANERDNSDNWLEKVTDDLARWFLVSYEKVIGNKARKIGAEQLPHIKKIIEENREGLR
jgi:CRISPR-associated protein Csy1